MAFLKFDSNTPRFTKNSNGDLEPVVSQDPVFTQKVRSVLIDNKSDRNVRKQKKGKLDGVGAWRAHTGSSNIFKQKIAKKGKFYSVCVLFDESGSMCHYRETATGNRHPMPWYAYDDYRKPEYTSAFEMLGFLLPSLAESFIKSEVDLSLIGFNESLQIYKKFEGKSVDVKQIAKEKFFITNSSYDNRNCSQDYLTANRIPTPSCPQQDPRKFFASVRPTSGNHDYDAVKYALDMLSKRKGEKILVVLSDGKPRCDYPDRCKYPQHLQNPATIKKMIQGYKDITTIGIGLFDDTVEKIYPESFVVKQPNELPGQLTAMLGKHIKRL